MYLYRQAGTRLEHFKGDHDPLVVGAQQRADVLAWRVAEPLGHTSPAALLTDHLKASLPRHNLEQDGTVQQSQKMSQKIDLSELKLTFDRLKRSRMRLSMCGIFNEDAWISQNLAMRSK